MTQEAIDLLRRVKKHILQKPSRLRMSNYMINKTQIERGIDSDHSIITEGKTKMFTETNGDSGWGEKAYQKIPDCGTVGCIAGWCCILGTPGFDPTRDIADRWKAEELLGITYSGRLFNVSDWPEAHREAYYNAKTQKQRAKLVAEEIEIFITEQQGVSTMQSVV